MHLKAVIYSLLGLIAARIAYTIYIALLSPTRSIPGPILARFTRLWYFFSVKRGTANKDHIAIHRRYAKNGAYYAPIIRLGPDLYSIIEPDKQVYGVSSKMPKSDWYDGWQHPKFKPTLFPDRDIKRHNEQRRKFQNLYSLSSLKSYEGYVDECMVIFEQRLNEIAERDGSVDMGHWFQCYAFDVIGNITYSKRFGFLDQGRDVDGIISALDTNMPYSTLVGVYAWLHPWLFALLQKMPGSGAASRNKLMGFVARNKQAREAERKAREADGKEAEEMEEGAPEDFLDKILDMRRDQKKGITDYDCFMMGLSNVIAGSDTTAVSLSSVLYHLIKTPRAMKKLREEVMRKTKEGQCEEDKVSFAASQEMPYLQACIKEGLRLHAAVGLPLWRVVNEGGCEVSGQYLPAGSWLGINAWVSHYNKDVWGPDADQFRPERWIEAEGKGADALRYLEHYYLPFGLGSRTCIGKNISYLEMTKIIPQIVRNFDFELQRPDREWTCKNYWFVKPADFYVRISKLGRP